MKFLQLITLFALTAPCFAQDATPAPKKKPFEGFGNTALDQRPRGARMASPPPDVSSLPPRGAMPSRGFLSPGSTGLTFEAKTVSNGGGIAPATPGVSKGYLPPVKIETRESHPVLEVKVHNLAHQPETAHFDWYFVASGLNGQGRYVWDQGQRDVSLLAGGDDTETLESKSVEQRTINETHMTTVTGAFTNSSGGVTTYTTQQPTSSRQRTGSRPDGWIVRMFVGGVLMKVQASTAVFEQIARDPVQLDALLKMKPPGYVGPRGPGSH